MKHINLILTLMLITTLFGCAKASENNRTSPEGVSQGNGMASYASNYKYTISYKAGLQLIVKSDREIEINDSTFVTPGEELSSLTIKALDLADLGGTQLNSSDELLTHLTTKEPLAHWKKVQQPGSLGYYSEVKKLGFTNTDYYFFSKEKNVIFGRMLISNNSFHSQYIKPIISTFTFDYTSPTISEIKLDSSSITSGEYAKLLFKASDDISGLNLSAHSVTGIFTLNQEGGSEFRLQGEEIESLGDHWYSVKFKVENHLKTGSYSLVSFCIEDNVGNRLSLSSRPNNFCRSSTSTVTQAPLLPIIQLDISNPSLDALKEIKLNGLKLRQHKVKFGQQEGTLQFRATNAHLAVRYTGIFANYKSNSRITFDTTDVTALGDDWYSVQFKWKDRIPKGSYTLIAFTLRDSLSIKAALWGRFNGFYVFQGEDKKYVPTDLEMITIKIK